MQTGQQRKPVLPGRKPWSLHRTLFIVLQQVEQLITLDGLLVLVLWLLPGQWFSWTFLGRFRIFQLC